MIWQKENYIWYAAHFVAGTFSGTKRDIASDVLVTTVQLLSVRPLVQVLTACCSPSQR